MPLSPQIIAQPSSESEAESLQSQSTPKTIRTMPLSPQIIAQQSSESLDESLQSQSTPKTIRKKDQSPQIMAQPSSESLDESLQPHVGSFGFNRTGHVGISRAPNVKMAESYIFSFLKHEKVGLMDENYEGCFLSWARATENAEKALCDVQVIQQFATWLCTHARKTVGTELQYLMLGSVKDILSSTRKIFNFVFPSNSIFTGAKEQTWYSTLRYSSQQEIVRRDMRLEAFF